MPTSVPLSRGVFRLPWLGPNDERYFVAVDRQGRRLLKATVLPGHESAPIEDAMWELLDRMDPEVLLRLVS